MTQHTSPSTINNFNQCTASIPPLQIFWMYPNTLSLHGGRGDLMALLRFATMANRPVEIHRIEHPGDPIPWDRAHMLYFSAGDLACMPDVIRGLAPCRDRLKNFADRGGVIVANGSTGAILAKDLTKTDGTVIPGLGLLYMHWTQRKSVQGDDLWMKTADGMEIIGTEIKLADVTLEPGQKFFGKVLYGTGNCGNGYEGAIRDNIIYTGCLGPLLVRNPVLAMDLLYRASVAADIPCHKQDFSLPPEALPHETSGLLEAKKFIQKKMKT